MDRSISMRATKFFQRFVKEYKAGHATSIKLGTKNQNIILNNGREITKYNGDHVAELMRRINHYLARH